MLKTRDDITAANESADRMASWQKLLAGEITLEQHNAHVDERERRLGKPWAKRD